MLNDKVNQLLRSVKKNSTNVLQKTIHKSVNFKYNSVNLLIGRRGSGKTYNVFREILKLGFIPHNYSQFIYVSDKSNDSTFEDIKDVFPIPYDRVKYENALEFLKNVCKAKDDLFWLSEQGVTDADVLDDSSREEILGTLKLTDLKNTDVHTLVLFDDCINLFNKPNKENKELFRMLFENRQPKLTYFLALQDTVGISTQIKQNIDGLWFFGGFNRLKFSHMFSQISVDIDKEDLWRGYMTLTKRGALIFSFDDTGTKINILRN